MAKLIPGLGITGPLQNISIYSRKDIEEPIVRTKGGASKETIDTSPSFEPTRNLDKELGGKSTTSRCIRTAIRALKPIQDFHWQSALISFLTPVQRMDTSSKFGKRNVQLSRCPEMFQGYLLNRRNPLETVVHNPLSYTISKEHLVANVQIPLLKPGFNFSPFGTFPFYRWTFVLAIVPDFFYGVPLYKPQKSFNDVPPTSFYSEWMHVQYDAQSFTQQLQLEGLPGKGLFSLILAAGISFGIVKYGNIQFVKGAGAGKILAVQ